MPTVAVESGLYQRVEQVASVQKASPDDVFAEAVRRYLWQLDRRKISEESQAYRQRHAELRLLYLGQFIAMRDGQVVDHDADFAALRERTWQRYGEAPVMIRLVETEVDRPVTRHGFQVKADAP
jgi:hypothetical protein